MIRIVLAIFSLGSAAQAQSWDAFYSLCIAPLEAVKTIGGSPFEFAGENESVVGLRYDDGDIVLDVATDKNVFARQVCIVHPQTSSAAADLIAGYEAWQQSQIASGRYIFQGSVRPVLDQGDELPLGLYSNDFREPRLRVVYFEGFIPFMMHVEETFLES